MLRILTFAGILALLSGCSSWFTPKYNEIIPLGYVTRDCAKVISNQGVEIPKGFTLSPIQAVKKLGDINCMRHLNLQVFYDQTNYYVFKPGGNGKLAVLTDSQVRSYSYVINGQTGQWRFGNTTTSLRD